MPGRDSRYDRFRIGGVSKMGGDVMGRGAPVRAWVFGAIAGSMLGCPSAAEYVRVERNGSICDSLPNELLEESYADRQALFTAGVAEKYGWRVHDSEFEAATGMGASTIDQDFPRRTMIYEEMVYQRLDVDANGKVELLVFSSKMSLKSDVQDSQLVLLCETDNWRTSYCDSLSQKGVGRWRLNNFTAEHRQPTFEWLRLELYRRNLRRGNGRESYIYGATLLPGGPFEIAQNGPLTSEYLAPAQPIVALTSLYLSDPENPEQSAALYGAELLGIHPDGFAQLGFCTWSM